MLSKVWNKLRKNKTPRVLCLFCHYFGPSEHFSGASSRMSAAERKESVTKAYTALRAIPYVDVKVCGINGKNLLPIDLDFSALKEAQFLVYEVLNSLADFKNSYDYFLVIEDDILISPEILSNIIEFDQTHSVKECLHPNRVELGRGVRECVDLRALEGWTSKRKIFNGVPLRVARNPHSAFLCLSQKKLKYCLKRVDPEFRGTIIGGYMASAFAHFHKPFDLYRPYNDLHFHSIEHLDCWVAPHLCMEKSKHPKQLRSSG